MKSRYVLRRKLYQGRQFFQSAKPTVTPASGEATAGLEKEIADLREFVIRQRAEFDNFRKRTQREKDQVREAAAEGILSRLLPVLDNLERALASAETAADVKPVRDGVSMIHLQLVRALESEGLAAVNALHQPFDPKHHDALAAEERSDIPENHVCEVLLPGYLYKEKLLRPAMVKVAKSPSSEEMLTN